MKHTDTQTIIFCYREPAMEPSISREGLQLILTPNTTRQTLDELRRPERAH